MKRLFNVRGWLTALGLMMTLLGLGNLLGAEDWAADQWTGAQGRELDIATGLELTWGTKIITVGLMILILSFVLKGAARARFGVIAIATFILGEIFTVTSLSSKGYGEDESIPWAFVIIPVLVTLVTLVLCVMNWNDVGDEGS